VTPSWSAVSTKKSPELKWIGWREWVSLPELGVPTVKAKIDTGARTSSLHAYDIEEFRSGKRRMVRFRVQPEQRSSRHAVVAEAPLVDKRSVRPSSGHAEVRHVILTRIELMDESWEAELTLTRRDEMGFRMLLGRQALRGRFLVDSGTSFRNGRRAKGTRRLARKGERK